MLDIKIPIQSCCERIKMTKITVNGLLCLNPKSSRLSRPGLEITHKKTTDETIPKNILY